MCIVSFQLGLSTFPLDSVNLLQTETNPVQLCFLRYFYSMVVVNSKLDYCDYWPVNELLSGAYREKKISHQSFYSAVFPTKQPVNGLVYLA